MLIRILTDLASLGAYAPTFLTAAALLVAISALQPACAQQAEPDPEPPLVSSPQSAFPGEAETAAPDDPEPPAVAPGAEDPDPPEREEAPDDTTPDMMVPQRGGDA